MTKNTWSLPMPFGGVVSYIRCIFLGYGVYTYENSFFRYEGEWVAGKKHGKFAITLTRNWVGVFCVINITKQTSILPCANYLSTKLKVMNRNSVDSCMYISSCSLIVHEGR